MRRVFLGLLFGLSLFSLPALAKTGSAAATEMISVADIKPGMKGYGLTVFEGVKIERFEIKVVGVLNGFFPKQDLIIINCIDQKMQHAGVVAGMSGSPIYIEDKLAGALSYTLVGFGKDAIAGVTPIQSMLDVGKLPTRGVEAVTKGTPATKTKATAQANPMSDEDASWEWPQPTEPMLPSEMGPYEFAPLATPMSLSGFSPKAAKSLQKAFAAYGIEVAPMGGGAMAGTGGATYYSNLDVKYEPGAAIGVTLMTGDMGMTGTCTVTYVDVDKVYFCGHPFFGFGEEYFPTNTAWIHLIMASQQRSYKLSSPIKLQGASIQDRQAAVMSDSDLTVPMVPLNIQVENVGGGTQNWKVQMVRHPMFTPSLVRSAIENALEAFNQDVAPSTYSMEVTIKLEGKKPFTITEQFFSNIGIPNNRQNMDAAESLRALRDLSANPFEPIALESVDVKLKVSYKEEYAIIKGAQLQSTEVKAGDRVNLYVTVFRFNAPDEIRVIPIDIPKEAEGQALDIVVDAGSRARPEMAVPENIDGMIDNYTKRYPPRAFVVTTQLPTKGVTFKGRVVPSLPESVLDSLNPGTSTEKARSFKTSQRFVLDQPELIFGRATLRVQVTAPDEK